MQQEFKKYFRPKEAGIYLGVGTSTIFLLIREGKLKANKISTQVTLIDKDDLDRLVVGGVE